MVASKVIPHLSKVSYLPEQAETGYCAPSGAGKFLHNCLLP